MVTTVLPSFVYSSLESSYSLLPVSDCPIAAWGWEYRSVQFFASSRVPSVVKGWSIASSYTSLSSSESLLPEHSFENLSFLIFLYFKRHIDKCTMMILYNSITSYQKCHHWIPFLQWKLRNSYPSIRLRPFDFGLLPRPIFQPNFRILFSRAFARDQVNRGQPRPPKISFPEILFFFFFFYIVFNRTYRRIEFRRIFTFSGVFRFTEVAGIFSLFNVVIFFFSTRVFNVPEKPKCCVQ